MGKRQIEEIERLHFNKIRRKKKLEYERVVPLIIPDNHLKILDIGCGEGFIASLIKKKTNQVIAMDIVNKYERFIKQRGINFVKHNLEKLPYPFPSEEFDVITILSVLEHLYRPDKCLEETHRILKKDGQVIICLPNYASLLHTLSNLRGQSFHSLTDEYNFYGHIKYFTYSSILELLTLKGFFVDTVISPLPTITKRYRKLSRWKKILAKAIVYISCKISPRWCQAPIIIAKKQKTKMKKKIM